MGMTNLIAKTGENNNFMAFWAHAGFSFMLLVFFPHIYVLLMLILGTAIKEFWFDIKYETNPPQTWKDGLLDFSGYMAGIALLFFRLYI
jgi:hypothetical protein